MEKRKLGTSGLEITRIGLGTWAMGGGGWRYAWGPQDDKESIATIRRALDLGINWIDTAPIYGFGHAEMIVGRALKGMSERPLIATKCGILWDEKRRVWNDIKKESICKEVEASLIRLKTEAIDLYQVHWPLPEADVEEAWDTMRELVKEGKIRYAGVSNFNAAQLEKITPLMKPVSLQPPYSMLERSAEDELLPYCAGRSVGVVVYSPLQKGVLTEAFSRERVLQLPMDDHRKRKSYFLEPELSVNLALVEGLRSIAAGSGRTVSQLAIAWVLRKQEVTSALVGSRRCPQIEDNIHALDKPLLPEEESAIEELLERRRKALRA